jgi:hypothetical protein
MSGSVPGMLTKKAAVRTSIALNSKAPKWLHIIKHGINNRQCLMIVMVKVGLLTVTAPLDEG